MTQNLVEAQDFSRVPGREHYAAKYVKGGRIFSFAHQIDAVLGLEPETVMEVGPGPGVVTAALRTLGVQVTTVDVQPELEPDVVASVLELPFEAKAFDVALCCQVLEHLPFEQFGSALAEIRRVVAVGLVLSLPDVTRHCDVAFRLPRTGRHRWCWDMPRLRPRRIPPERLERHGHYWEIGFEDYRRAVVLAAIRRAGWRSVRSWRVPELTWHRFFLLQPSEPR